MLKLFRFVLIFVSFCVSNNLYSQKLSISIYNSIPLSTILVTPTQGQYNLIIGDSTYNLKVNQILYLSRLGDFIVVRTANQILGTWKRVTIIGKTGNDVIRVKPIVPATPARLYDDNLSFYVDINKILAINLIDQEKYIAAVVEAEGGYHRNRNFTRCKPCWFEHIHYRILIAIKARVLTFATRFIVRHTRVEAITIPIYLMLFSIRKV